MERHNGNPLNSLFQFCKRWVLRIWGPDKDAPAEAWIPKDPRPFIEYLICLGGFHYEAWLRERELVDDARGEILGIVDYPTWVITLLCSIDDEAERRIIRLIQAYLPSIYLKSKASVIGRTAYPHGCQDFRVWSRFVLSKLDSDESREITPHLRDLYDATVSWSRRKMSSTTDEGHNAVIPAGFISNRSSAGPQVIVRKQLVILWVGVILNTLVGLFPPWVYTWQHPGSQGGEARAERPAGHGFILTPPSRVSAHGRQNEPTAYDGVGLDTERLVVEWTVITMIVGGLLWTLRVRRLE